MTTSVRSSPTSLTSPALTLSLTRDLIVFNILKCHHSLVGICHNEDGNLIDFDRTSIIEVELIKGETKQVFYSYCYAGQLPTAGIFSFIHSFIHSFIN